MAYLQLESFLSKTILLFRVDAFASGGEGALHEVVEPLECSHLVAKVYHPNKRTLERAAKMKYLLQHPPDIETSTKQPNAAWVMDLLYQDGEFVGVLMAKIKGAKLTQLCLSKLPRKIDSVWERFAFGSLNALELRLRTCFNIATVLYQIHRTEQYVLVDLKPENILMQANGLIALVDMDSVQVAEHGTAIFEAPVATPEYSPPEYYHDKSPTKEETWDRFSLAVIFYQLLLGLHPFAASAKAPFDELVGLDKKIQHGLYVHDNQKQHLFKIIPPPHQRLVHLPLPIRTLFNRCFQEGHEQPESRPTAAEWCITLGETLGLNINISNFLGPDNFSHPPSPYFQPTSELVDFNALIWKEKALSLVAKPQQEPQIQDPTLELDPAIHEKIQQQILSLVEQERSAAIERQKEQHQKIALKEQHQLDQLIETEKNINLIPLLFIGSLVALAFFASFNPLSLILSLPISLRLLWKMSQSMRLPPFDEDIIALRQKIIRLKPALDPISMDEIISPLLACSFQEFPQKMADQANAIELAKNQLLKDNQAIMEEYQRISQLNTAPYLELIQEFKPDLVRYKEDIKRFKGHLKTLNAARKLVLEKEQEAILERLQSLVQHPDFKTYQADNYKDLHKKVRLSIQDEEKAIKELVVYKKYPALELQTEKERQKAFKTVDRRRYNFVKTIRQQSDKLLPFKFALDLQVIHKKKQDAVLGLIQEKDPNLLPSPPTLLYKKINDLNLEVDWMLDFVFESFGVIIEHWDASNISGLFRHKKVCTILVQKPTVKPISKNYSLDLSRPQDAWESITKLVDELKITLADLYFIMDTFPQTVLHKDKGVVSATMDQVMAKMTTVSKQYSIFVHYIASVQESDALQEEYLAFEKKLDQTTDLRQNIEQEVYKSETALEEKRQVWEKDRPMILEQLEVFKTHKKEEIEAHRTLVLQRLEQQLISINQMYLNALAQEQDQVIRARIEAYNALEKAQEPLTNLRNRYLDTAKIVQEQFKQEHLLLQKEVEKAQEKMQEKYLKLFNIYQKKNNYLTVYNKDIKQLELSILQGQKDSQSFYDLRVQQATFEALRDWIERKATSDIDERKISLDTDVLVIKEIELLDKNDRSFSD